MAEIDLREVLVWVNGEDRNGRLAFSGERLVGVLVELTAADGDAGKWFLEAGFGPASGVTPPPLFDQLWEAEQWLTRRVESVTRRSH